MANNTIIEMDSLKERSIRIYSGMIAVFPQLKQEATVNTSELAPKFNGAFSVNNSTVSYVTDGEVFVTPYTRLAIRSLYAAGFRQDYFYVPFSNWDYPKAEQARWKELREQADKSYAEDFVDDCMLHCDEKNIGTISDETLKNCFEMPVTGVQVKHRHFEDCYYPVINTICFDCTVADKIGHFCTNNGRVVFTYRNGKTYVAKGYKVLGELRAAGYTEEGIFVPFSNGEQILDPVLRARWESITK